MNSDEPASVPLAAVQPGARLAAAVFGSDGQMLLAAGSLLGETSLAQLAARGVVAVAVEAEAQRDEAALIAARQALTRRLEHMFRRGELKGPTQVLFKAVLEHRLEALR